MYGKSNLKICNELNQYVMDSINLYRNSRGSTALFLTQITVIYFTGSIYSLYKTEQKLCPGLISYLCNLN